MRDMDQKYTIFAAYVYIEEGDCEVNNFRHYCGSYPFIYTQAYSCPGYFHIYIHTGK